MKDHGHCAVFMANNVMANVADPGTIVCGIQKLLSPAGTFIFETGYLRYLAEDMCLLTTFTTSISTTIRLPPLVSFFERFGMVIVHVDESTSKGSSIRCYVQ